ncbi:MAG: hypothetical protein A3C35_02495 [Omnitrophica bacterium RIFCSPHIGHO2_02_FULL_46_11]|nr:MAG: hypothetical protein A3C35_02495 [Omnitrophica bacterium RIFCSPHIGHO2_02_FULL_46_11]OGW85583.1 MAG: hypothetical protein A3A81_01210 [Omnitrophica bacterium RIFCSPLOWO2_01_FULL_45_10b]
MTTKVISSKDTQNFIQEPSAYCNPPILKDSFKKCYQLFKEKNVSSVIDIGCASGDFLYYLSEGIKGLGVEVSHVLYNEARRRVRKKNVEFLKTDAKSLPAKLRYRDKTYDAVTLLGILHTFLDIRPLLNPVLALKPKLIIIHSPFNEGPVDARHFHRLANNHRSAFQCAYSIFSKDTLVRYLKKMRVKRYQFFPFEMEKELLYNPSYPLRNYHVTLSNGQRYLTNGIGILFKEYFLVIEL